MPFAPQRGAERVSDDLQQLLAEPAPCDACPHSADCAARLLACSAYALYLAGYRESRWRAAPRTDATHDRYLELLTSTATAPPPRRNRTSRKRDHDELPLEMLDELFR